MKAPLIHLASVVFDSPLAILPEKLEDILAVVGPRLTPDDAALTSLLRSGVLFTPGLHADTILLSGPPQSSDKPYAVTEGGVAVIPIRGVLMQKGGFMQAVSGCSSYEGIQNALDTALSDESVKAVLFDVDSPGGTTHGCFELSDYIRSVRGQKPMCAIANPLAASAAYCLASAADDLWLTMTASAGSVGVFALHCNRAGADKQAGVEYEYISFGDKKTDGNEHEPLSRSARRDMQAEVDREGMMFVSRVAKNRGTTDAAILATKAGVLYGEAALPLLADKVGTLEGVTAYLEEKVNGVSATALDSPRRSGRILATGKPASAERTRVEGKGHVEEPVPAIAPHKTVKAAKKRHLPARLAALREVADYATTHSKVEFAERAVEAMRSFTTAELLEGDATMTAAQLFKIADAKAEEARQARLLAIEAEKKAEDAEEADDAEEAEDARKKAKKARKKADTYSEDADEAKKAALAAKKAEADDSSDDGDEDEKKKEEARKAAAKKAKAKAEAEEADDAEARRGRKMDDAEAAVQIAEMCAIAGQPALAAEYITKRMSVADARKALLDLRAAASQTGPLNPNFGIPLAGADPMSVIDQKATAMIAASGGKMSRADAIYQVCSSEPALYDSFRSQKDDLSRMGTSQQITEYVMKARARMPSLGLSTAGVGEPHTSISLNGK